MTFKCQLWSDPLFPYQDSAEYRSPKTDYFSVSTDLNAKILTKQAKKLALISRIIGRCGLGARSN